MATLKELLQLRLLILKYGFDEAEDRMLKILLRKRSMLDVELMDTLDGKFEASLEDNEDWVAFGRHKFGLGSKDNYDSIPTWIHEFTEHAVGHIILHHLVYSGVKSKSLLKHIGNIWIKTKCGTYNPKMKHIVTSLCTESNLDSHTITPDEFAIVFGVEDGKIPDRLLKPKSTLECMFEGKM